MNDQQTNASGIPNFPPQDPNQGSFAPHPVSVPNYATIMAQNAPAGAAPEPAPVIIQPSASATVPASMTMANQNPVPTPAPISTPTTAPAPISTSIANPMAEPIPPVITPVASFVPPTYTPPAPVQSVPNPVQAPVQSFNQTQVPPAFVPPISSVPQMQTSAPLQQPVQQSVQQPIQQPVQAPIQQPINSPAYTGQYTTAQMLAMSQNAPQYSAIPKKKSHKGLMWTIIILIFLVGMAAAYYFFIQKPSESWLDDSLADNLSRNNGVTATSSSTTAGENEETEEDKIATILADFDEFKAGLSESSADKIDAVSEDRQVTKINTAKYLYTQGLGYKFKTPWGVGTVSANTKNSTELKQFDFKNGKKLLFSCLPISPREEFLAMKEESEPEAAAEFDAVLAFLGTRADSSSEYFKFLMTTTSEDLKNSTSSQDALALARILDVKSGLSLFSRTPVYRFDTGTVTGYQMGKYPGEKGMRIAIFADKGMCEINAPDTTTVTQADIDAIISTFTKI